MKLFRIFLIFQTLVIAPLLLSSAEANNVEACYSLFRPLENSALKIKGSGGTWALFERREIFRKHAIVGLHVDSKITALIFTINYLCESQEGIPVNEVAGQVVSMLEKRGREGFVEQYLVEAHELGEIKDWLKYADYFKAHHKRKLDFNETRTTIKKAQEFFERYLALSHKLSTTNDVEGIAKDGKALIEDVVKFNTVDPLLKQANLENSKIPQVSNLLNIADEM
ncbi:MAG: hypothetical protein H8E42_10210 [Nitrospinae bacterium]|nr:hypothetical protein [Nitrospinota bacterium]MBL7020535.1 hypothetical protein [Nitrospinaceae bacterium]